ncbi:MAG: phosphotransferase family protein [Bacteroidetes bacterium]|nr:MAG: phosphotransferase family protein [Bacteroidota bacterium]
MLDQAKNTRAGEELNIENLKIFFKEQLPHFQGDITIKQFPSGYSNLTYLLQIGEQELVLRRPPFGAKVKAGHDMAREFNILKTIFSAYPKVPKPIIYSNDLAVLGAEFYVMQRVKGVILRNTPPKEFLLTSALIRQISEASIDNLVQIHAIDVQKNGLETLGKAEGYVQRQVEGWIGRYEKAKTDDVLNMQKTATWLQANMPISQAICLIHNDYKYDNLVLNPENLSEIMAVLDWEMATIGDPLMDLGTTLAYWADADDLPALRHFSLTSFEGNLNRQEIAELYAQKSGRNLSEIVFYYAFGCYKIAVIVQQIYFRFVQGFTQDQRFANLIHMVYAFAENAVLAIEKGKISNFR